MLDVKKLLTKIVSALNTPIYTTRSATASGTVSGNSNARISGTLPTVSGYTPAAIMYVRSNAGANICITEFGINYNGDEHNISSVVKNVGSSSVNVTHTYGVIYLKKKVGGVERKLLNTLKMLTSERRWALC